MSSTRWLVLVCAAVALASSAVVANSALDADSFKRFGGTYLSDCTNPASPRVTVFEDALVFIQGDQRVAGANVQAAHSYFGQSPPPGYQVALVSELGKEQLLCIVYSDASGDYLKLDGDQAVRAQIGKAAQALTYRRCATEGKAASTRTAPPPSRTTTGEGVTASGMLEIPAFKAAYHKALRTLVREPWLATLDGPSPETRKVRVGGTEYLLISACKNHDCADHNVALLYSAARRAVYGKVYQQGRTTWLGSPGAALSKELERLWRAEWRSSP